MGETKLANSILVQKSDGKRTLGGPGRRWEDIIMNLTEVRWGSVD
jgi:hypothetical protein